MVSNDTKKGPMNTLMYLVKNAGIPVVCRGFLQMSTAQGVGADHR